MINITKTYLPDKKKLSSYIDRIYSSQWVTNDGLLVQELESKLEKFLGVKNLVLVANGTLALQIAFKLLDLKKRVITTPFTFVGTTGAMVWENLLPQFVDIDGETLNIDANKIERSITKNVTGIVPVHVFGNSCDVIQIGKIAKKHNLKVVYDGAHAFGVSLNKKSLLSFGDITILSFHATKIFHTIEGGALIIKNNRLYEKAKQIRTFGFNKGVVKTLGINAKMNELQAAVGLCVLDKIDWLNNKRKKIVDRYKSELDGLVRFQKLAPHCSPSYGYCPIILKNKRQTEKVQKALSQQNIYARRYFHPSLDKLKYLSVKSPMKVARDISERILCLPVYHSLDKKTQAMIVYIIKGNL